MRTLRDQAISEAARLLYVRGPVGVNMDRLAQRLRVSKKTLYNLFGCKQDLIGAVMDQELRNLSSQLEEALCFQGGLSQKSIADAVRPLRRAYGSISGMVLDELYAHYPAQYEALERWWSEYARPRLVSLVKRAIDADVIFLQVSPGDLVTFVSEIIVWTEEKDRRSPHQQGSTETEEVVHAIVARAIFGSNAQWCRCIS